MPSANRSTKAALPCYNCHRKSSARPARLGIQRERSGVSPASACQGLPCSPPLPQGQRVASKRLGALLVTAHSLHVPHPKSNFPAERSEILLLTMCSLRFFSFPNTKYDLLREQLSFSHMKDIEESCLKSKYPGILH